MEEKNKKDYGLSHLLFLLKLVIRGPSPAPGDGEEALQCGLQLRPRPELSSPEAEGVWEGHQQGTVHTLIVRAMGPLTQG